jgi:hypothetical protein
MEIVDQYGRNDTKKGLWRSDGGEFSSPWSYQAIIFGGTQKEK